MAKTKIFKVRLILENKGRILLLKQTDQNGGKFTLVGGAVEENEDPVQALIRETHEEAGIIISRKDIKLVHTLFKRKEDNLRIVLYFKVTSWRGELESREPKKFKKVAWYSLNELPKNTSPTVRFVLSQYQQGFAYSELTKSALGNRAK